MLVLTRKVGSKILIGDNIKIILVSIDGDRARIGIEAPREIRVLREESIDKTIEENKLAAEIAVDLQSLFHAHANNEEKKENNQKDKK